MKKKRKIGTVVAIFMLFGGIGLFSYPYISDFLFQKQADSAIASFRKAVENGNTAVIGEKESEKADPLQTLYQKMQAYNEQLFLTGQSGLVDPFSYEQPSFDLSAFGFAENMIGYIEIPKIEVRLPIYLGASKENLQKGAVHLSQTSLPIGGENTNCVIAAHRGSGARFRNIHTLEIGDELHIVNFRERLTYQVVETKVISPDEISEIMIQPERDLVTLSSCHPLNHNYQRYLVYAKRVQ